MNVVMRMVLHGAIFLVAGTVFVLGLGIGLSQNPDIGTLLWLVAAGIAVANAIWMTRRRR